MKIGSIIKALEDFAPEGLQEDWDNTGLQTGDRHAECSGVMICVDVTEAVVAEAVDLGCNLIVSHHPLIFRGIKRLTGATPGQRALIECVRRDIAVYSAHTSLDSTRRGISHRMAQMLGAEVTGVLHPTDDRLLQLTVYVPRDKAYMVSTALLDVADARCVTADAELATAEADTISHTPLTAVTTNVAVWRRGEVESTLSGLKELIDITWQFGRANAPEGLGLGVTARFDEPISRRELVQRVKDAFGSPVVRASEGPETPDERITRIAMCGGAGGEFIPTAIRRGAQAYLCSDTRYHDFVDYGGDILLLDIGHYESENCAKQIIYDVITEKFSENLRNFAVYKSQTEKNSINYL